MLGWQTVLRVCERPPAVVAPNPSLPVVEVDRDLLRRPDIGGVLLDGRDDGRALEHYLEGLAATEKLVQHGPANLYFQRYRADAFESLGRYYSTLATRPAAQRPVELKAQARSWFQKSQAVWQEWTHRKAALPYAERRQSQIAELLK